MTNNEHETSYSAHDMTSAPSDSALAQAFRELAQTQDASRYQRADIFAARIQNRAREIGASRGDSDDWFAEQLASMGTVIPLKPQPAAAGELPEPVGVAGTMPGTGGFTMAAFKAEDVPVGTKLYASAAAAECRRDAESEQAPVAWRYWNEKSKSWNTTCSEVVAGVMRDSGRAVEPLYTAPQQPAAEFINDGNSEADFIAHHADACTACGGSGHKADQQPAAPSGEAVAEVVEFCGLRVPSWIGTGDAPDLPAGTKLFAAPQQPAGVDEAMVFRLAVWMATQDGHDDPHRMIWQGSPPEPWGEVWNRYEYDARAALTAALAAQKQGGAE